MVLWELVQTMVWIIFVALEGSKLSHSNKIYKVPQHIKDNVEPQSMEHSHLLGQGCQPTKTKIVDLTSFG